MAAAASAAAPPAPAVAAPTSPTSSGGAPPLPDAAGGAAYGRAGSVRQRSATTIASVVAEDHVGAARPRAQSSNRVGGSRRRASSRVAHVDNLHKGYLEKQGEVNPAWKPRYFVLTPAYVYYYETHLDYEKSKTAKGFIELKSIRTVSECGTDGHFEIDTDFHRCFQLKAETADEGRQWVTKLRRALVAPSPLALQLQRASTRKGLLAARAEGEAAEAAAAAAVAAGDGGGDEDDEDADIGEVLDEYFAGTSVGSGASASAAAASASASGAAAAAAAAGAGGGGGAASGGGVDSIAEHGGEDGDDDSVRGTPSPAPHHRTSSTGTRGGTSAAAPGTGDTFRGLYKIGKEIGHGSYSTVHFGLHRTTQQMVAVKVVRKARMAEREAKALRSEVEVLMRLRHPNIVQLHGFYEDRLHFYLVMDFVAGGDLFDQILKMHHYSERDAQQIVHTLVAGLQYCHARGIAHRDLKPENILVTTNDPKTATIKIADWGFARVVTADGLTTSCGSPSYVAPEVLYQADGGYGVQVDMWSLGVITYALLCGFLPFADPVQNTLFQKIVDGNYVFESPYWDTISPEAKDFIEKLLETDPAKRMTAEEAAGHAWLAKAEVSAKALEHRETVHKMLQRHDNKATKVLYEGFLMKKGHWRRNWLRRLFILTPKVLLYYDTTVATKDMSTAKPKGSIPLDDIQRVEAKSTEKFVGFRVLCFSGKDFEIHAPSEVENKEWVKQILYAAEHADIMRKAKIAYEQQMAGVGDAGRFVALAEGVAAELGLDGDDDDTIASATARRAVAAVAASVASGGAGGAGTDAESTVGGAGGLDSASAASASASSSSGGSA